MPAYEICYLNGEGALAYKFSADCDDDNRHEYPGYLARLPLFLMTSGSVISTRD